MKEQLNIDALFQKAANAPSTSSFGETKELFQSTVGVTKVNFEPGKSRVLTLKNALIMLAIVSTIITAIFLIPGNDLDKNQLNKEAVVVPNAGDKDSTETIQNQVVLIESEVESVENKEAMLEFVNGKESIVIPLGYKGIPKLKKAPLEVKKMKPLKYARAYQLPVLSEDQKSANKKRKKKMVKAVNKFDKKQYAYVPSGTFDFHGTNTSVQAFYMQTAEVSNIEYKTFLFDLLIQGRKDDFMKAKPDQAMWTKMFGEEMKPMQSLYFSSEAYDDYPVVNVSREGAEMYCVWLTLEANKVNKDKNDPLINDLRIPVRSEWELAASGSGKHAPFPWGGPFAQNDKGCFLANYDPSLEGELMDTTNCEGCDTINLDYSDGAALTAKTKSYNPNEYGLYNMSGNAAEMVYGNYQISDGKLVKKDPGTAGGGWMSNFDSLKISGKDEHDGLTTAHPNVGFRVVSTYLRK
ncbi:MAG: sulfatase activating formylglycine-generating enzyme [Crocinitomicaceae bacterium]|jgi:formylglycine-generating enzyme required for sulfatase activity